ncbi:MAG: hypothetical protein C5B50_07015 [Verrucomicrobia bacterium]|nr:MAG: hypothetical protein C5B50_07015 [Verrucomicrobiota bacterium]
MIRRDYILRMIEEFFQMLSRLNAQKKGELWQDAAGTLDEEFQRLVGTGAEGVARLSGTELLAQLVEAGPTHLVQTKALMLATLLKETGDVAAASGQAEQSRACYLKGLHLLLDTFGRGEVTDCPEFVPQVEAFVLALAEAPLPLSTHARLMEHYERDGEFGKAEDALFAMLETEPDNPDLLNFGIAFYERLAAHADTALAEGNLPRAEVEAGLRQLRDRKQHQS